MTSAEAVENFWLYELNELLFSPSQIALVHPAATCRCGLPPVEVVALPLAALPLIWVFARRRLVSSQKPALSLEAPPDVALASKRSWLQTAQDLLQKGLHAVGRFFRRVLAC